MIEWKKALEYKKSMYMCVCDCARILLYIYTYLYIESRIYMFLLKEETMDAVVTLPRYKLLVHQLNCGIFPFSTRSFESGNPNKPASVVWLQQTSRKCGTPEPATAERLQRSHWRLLANDRARLHCGGAHCVIGCPWRESFTAACPEEQTHTL